MKYWIFSLIYVSTFSYSLAARKVFGYEILKDFPSECWEATKIDDITRRFDKPEHSPTSTESDNNLKPGWYWFQGGSGNVLKEGYDLVLKPGATAPNFCSTTLSGTLMGSHPTEEEGIVEMTVCFRNRFCYREGLNCECERTKSIYVRNCRRHYIYFLVPTNKGERYCSNEITMPKKSDPVNVSDITECKQNRKLPKSTSVTDTRLWDEVQDVHCDEGLYGWYRFNEKSTEMASECLENQNITRQSLYGQPCGANFRGWIVDRHPTVDEGRVQRRVCFSYDNRCYCEFYANIAVRNCGGYYVYRLNSVPTCKARYCAAPSDKKAVDNDYKKPDAPGAFDMCKDYLTQYDPDRLWSYTSPTVMKCDAGLYGKYRFGSKYTPWRIKEGCDRRDSNSVTHRCGSNFHGYMVGTHPKEREGYVERVVCFENSDGPCECQHTTTVGVQNCGKFFVYYFKGVPSCSLRYCMVANNSASIRLNPALPPLYEIPTPHDKPVAAKVGSEKDDSSNSGLVASTTALSLIILIIIILLIILIIILIVKVWPVYRENRRRGQRTPSYVSSNEGSPPPMKKQKQKKKQPSPPPSNGGVQNEPEQIAPYPSVLPPADEPDPEDDIPVDLQLTDDDDVGDCDTLMKKEDMVKPESYEKLNSKDSAV